MSEIDQGVRNFFVIVGIIAIIVLAVLYVDSLNNSSNNYSSSGNNNPPYNLPSNKYNIEDKTFVLEPSRVYSICGFGSEKNVKIQATIKASNPVDIFWTASKSDVDLLLKRSTFINYPSCAGFSILNYEDSCVIDDDGCIAISNINGDRSSTISLEIWKYY